MSREIYKAQDLFKELFFKPEYTSEPQYASEYGRGVKWVPKTDSASVRLRSDFYTKLISEAEFKKILRPGGMIPSPETAISLKKYFIPNNEKYDNHDLNRGLIQFITIAGDIHDPAIIEKLWGIIYKVLVKLREETMMNKRVNRKPGDNVRRPGENIRRQLGDSDTERFLPPPPKSMTELEQNDDDAGMNEIIRTMRAARLDSKRTSASNAVAPGDAVASDSGGRRRKSRKSRKSSNKKRKQRKTKRRRY